MTETKEKLHITGDKEVPLVHRHLGHLPGDSVQIAADELEFGDSADMPNYCGLTLCTQEQLENN
jgi:hypothetical protein